MKPRVRFAPSPTGPLHIGGVRTALYNYLFAKQRGGDFILRIEDTDAKRTVDNGIAIIIETLAKLGVNFDEGAVIDGDKGDYGPYRQRQRAEKTGRRPRQRQQFLLAGDDLPGGAAGLRRGGMLPLDATPDAGTARIHEKTGLPENDRAVASCGNGDRNTGGGTRTRTG